MKQRETQTYTCRHCSRTFTDAGLFLTHDCDAPATVAPAQRDVAAILSNAPRCQVESDGDCLWA